MRYWNDLSLRLKLAVGFGLILLLAMGLGLRGFWGLGDLGERFARMVRLQALVHDLHDRQAAHLDWTQEMHKGLAGASLADSKAEENPNACAFGQWFHGEGRRDLERLIPEAGPLLAAMEEPHAAVHRIYQQMRQQDANSARTTFREALLPNQERFRALLGRLKDLAQSKDANGEREVQARISDHRQVIALFAGAALLCGLAMGAVIARGVVRPIERVVRAAGRIAKGDLTAAGTEAALNLDRLDEIGALNRAFADMARALTDTAHKMRRVAEGDLTVDVTPRSQADLMTLALADMLALQRETTVRLQEAVDALSSAIEDISASSAQFSLSAEETAAAVSQTSVAVEQIKVTARVSSQRAAEVAQTARQASDVARDGVRSTRDLRETMGLVSGKMDLSAQNIVRLNEKTRRIGQVVGIVSALADRSAILAVNGSIEAAKAGEDNHGFQVVADEIKTLAVESKQAAAQVRWLLQDIQKATGSVALAAEEGGKAVVGGLEQSAQAERSIVELADHATEGAKAAAQIASASAEELLGLSQAVQAMENVRQASAQNMQSAHRLARSVQGLEEISRVLDALARRYVA